MDTEIPTHGHWNICARSCHDLATSRDHHMVLKVLSNESEPSVKFDRILLTRVFIAFT